MPKGRARDDLIQRTLKLFDPLLKESDRAAALIAAEMLSDSLEKLLRAQFGLTGLAPREQNTLLIGFHAPFHSFAMRIWACRAFGLLPPDICAHLHAIREIRNHCAHPQAVATLDDHKVQSWVRGLHSYLKQEGMDPKGNHKHMLLGACNNLGVEIFKSAIVILRKERATLRKREAELLKTLATSQCEPARRPPNKPRA